MEEYAKKHLEDIFNACREVESFFEGQPKVFSEFSKDILRQRAVERNVEIMGEAINRIKKDFPDIEIENAREIINTRNRVIHGYDSVTPEFLWELVIKYIPLLKEDIETLLSNKNQ
jgi:uncharacterized protein with HEPN domain